MLGHVAKELVERWGAQVNVTTNESKNSLLTALCVASVRGMPKVVEYLLSKGGLATTEVKCSARFSLHKNPKKSLRCTGVIPLDFARQMLAAEKKEGATRQDLVDLNHCINLLKGE